MSGALDGAPGPDAAGVDAVLNRLDELNNGGISYEVYSELHDLVSAIPAAVPDAATELAQLMAERDAGKQAEADRAYLYQLGLKLGAERDAALAAIERVRAVLAEERAWLEHLVESGDAMSRNVIGIGKVEAALDGAPEPDREAQLERVAARLREIVYLCGDDLGCQCEEAHDASADLARELSIIAAERPTLTADEVWAIAKAEHDFAGDSDNVGAFVDSLTDALRTAGVAFDEQPFIDSGYLLPVEGEKP